MFDPITARIGLALEAMNAPLPTDTPELDVLFGHLRRAAGARERAATEQRIWAVWCSHQDEQAKRGLRDVMDSLEVGDLTGASETLNTLVERWPEWAEPWNKRATLHFLEDRDAASLDDIVRVLRCEPRHFGALSGLGQICLRTGHTISALLAFERVLVLDPGVEEVRDAVEVLRREARHSIH